MFIGGWTQDPEWEEDRILIDEIEVYDIRRDTWTVETKIPTPRYHSGVALVQGKLYVMGGFHSDQQLFDRATGKVYSLKFLDLYKIYIDLFMNLLYSKLYALFDFRHSGVLRFQNKTMVN